jgi:tetratricopeptide (TPR) repeat protein
MNLKTVLKFTGALFLTALLIFLFACQNGRHEQKSADGETSRQDSELETLNRNILKDSLNPENFYLRSKYYLQYRDVNNALADINRAIQLNEDHAGYFVLLADIYLMSNRVPSCLEALKKAESLDQHHNDALLKLAEVYLILKDYNNTFNYTGKALDADRINPVAYFIRGYAYMETGDTSLAIKNFQAAVDQDQGYYEAYIELGSIYFALKDPLAGSYFKAATETEPNKPEAYYLLGLTYQEQGMLTEAVNTYNQLLAIAPDFKEAYYNLGYINLVYTQDFEMARQYFTKAIELDPAYIDAIFNRGYSYELLGDVQAARKDYRKTLELLPNYERSIEGLNRLDLK